MSIEIGTEIRFADGVGKVTEFLDEPNTGLCRLEMKERGMQFVIPVNLLDGFKAGQDAAQALIECEQDRLNAVSSGLETGWEHPATHTSYRKALAIAKRARGLK